jgi:hypothetical protein
MPRLESLANVRFIISYGVIISSAFSKAHLQGLDRSSSLELRPSKHLKEHAETSPVLGLSYSQLYGQYRGPALYPFFPQAGSPP